MVEGVGEAHRRRGLALACRRRRDCGNQDELAVGTAFQRLDEVHRYLGLVMAVGLEVLRRDTESFTRDVEDRPLLGGLGDFDIGFWLKVLRGGGRGFGSGRLRRSHESLVPGVSFALAANSPAAPLGPAAGFTLRTLDRPWAQAAVKPSVAPSTISPILPAMPLGSRAGKGFASNTWSADPLSVVHAPGAGLQPRMRLWICRQGLPQSMRALSGPQRPS